MFKSSGTAVPHFHGRVYHLGRQLVSWRMGLHFLRLNVTMTKSMAVDWWTRVKPRTVHVFVVVLDWCRRYWLSVLRFVLASSPEEYDCEDQCNDAEYAEGHA